MSGSRRFGLGLVDEATRKRDYSHRPLFGWWVESDADHAELGLEDVLSMPPRRNTVVYQHPDHVVAS